MKKKSNCEFHLCGTGTINTKGQIVIPKEARDKMGLQAGDHVTFLVKDKEALIIIPNDSIDKLMQYIESENNMTLISQ